jgi:hypothetical protein
METLRTVLRFRRMLLWSVALLLLVLIICAISAAPQEQGPQEQWNLGPGGTWNDPRLARVAAWLRGYPLYTPQSSGIITGNIYPPLGTLAFAPAAMFGHPVVAVIVGSILALLMNVGTGVGALTLWSRALQKSPEEAAEIILLGSILYLGLLIITDTTRLSLFAIHVDAPAIALMLWGVIFFAKWWATETPSSLALSAFFLGSAVWTKLLEVPLPFAFFIVTYLIGGLRPALTFSAWSLVTLAFWFLVLTPIVGNWHDFLFNIWTIPTGHFQVVGSYGERIRLYLAACVVLLRTYWLLYLVVFAMTLWLNVCAKRSGGKSLYLSFTLVASSLIAGLTVLPFTLIGLLKFGGDINSVTHSIQPVFFGLVIGSLTFVEVAKKATVQSSVVAQSVICAWLGLLFIAALPNRGILRYPFNIGSAPMLTAYNESKSDKVWFPGFPLSSLLATGHLYHFSYGIFDRYLAGKPVSKTQMLEGIPTPPFKLKYLHDSSSSSDMMPRYLGLSDDKIFSSRRTDGLWMEMLVQNFPS